jgi:hypothetical protein
MLYPDFVTPAPCHIPIEVVSVRVREHPHEERMPSWSCVLDRTGREREWMKKFEGGRSGTKWNCEIANEHERQRWRDEKTKQERVWSNIQNWGTNPVSFLKKNDLSLGFWRGDCHFVREFFNFKPAINKNSQRLNRNCRETNRQQDSYLTKNQELLRLSSLLQTNGGFWWM